MCNVSIEIKLNNKVIKTVDLDASQILKELNKQQYTKTEQDDIARVKAISMTDWINIRSFVEENGIALNDIESGVLSSYINKGTVTEKQARVLMFVLSKIQNTDFTPTHPF
jgi:hypothetical protein